MDSVIDLCSEDDGDVFSPKPEHNPMPSQHREDSAIAASSGPVDTQHPDVKPEPVDVTIDASSAPADNVQPVVKLEPATPALEKIAKEESCIDLDGDEGNIHDSIPEVSATAPLQTIEEQLQNDPELQLLRKDLTETEENVFNYQAILNQAQMHATMVGQKIQSRLRHLRQQADASFNWLTSFPWDTTLSTTQAKIFEVESFRPFQREALNATLLRRDVFAILPTGAGKSLIYQLAALVDGGLTLVVTPLISLSHDQQTALRAKGILAETIDSSIEKKVVTRIYRDILPKDGRVSNSSHPRKYQAIQSNQRANRDGTSSNATDVWVRDDMKATILFVTPEQVVKSKRLMSRLEGMCEAGHLSRICIDEAHCCSAWGHDFRNDYTKLGILRRQCMSVPILALSATCSTNTLEDVAGILEMKEWVTFRGSIDRSNLFYDVRHKKDNDDGVIADILDMLRGEFLGMSGIVYVLSRREAEVYATKLASAGILAACYHGDMEACDRKETHKAWTVGSVHVVVATIAFGLGIDNPHARFVVHATMATSIEGYYQESGRCGRDGRPGTCVVLSKARDFSRLSAFVADKGEERVRMFYDMYRLVTGRSRGKGGEMCRRAVIARAFGEEAPKREDGVERCCDLCQSRNNESVTGLVEVDVTDMAVDAVRILKHMASDNPDERVTMCSLATYWSSKGVKGRKLRGTIKPINNKVGMECRLEVLIELVFLGALQEFFRHSSYAVNGYVKCAKKADNIVKGEVKVALSVPEWMVEELVLFGGGIVVGEGAEERKRRRTQSGNGVPNEGNDQGDEGSSRAPNSKRRRKALKVESDDENSDGTQQLKAEN